jgi:hypothetical protein
MENNIKQYDIRMVALDLDGTTLNSERRISERTKRAFAGCREKGVHVVVSTGRVFTLQASLCFRHCLLGSISKRYFAKIMRSNLGILFVH